MTMIQSLSSKNSQSIRTVFLNQLIIFFSSERTNVQIGQNPSISCSFLFAFWRPPSPSTTNVLFEWPRICLPFLFAFWRPPSPLDNERTFWMASNMSGRWNYKKKSYHFYKLCLKGFVIQMNLFHHPIKRLSKYTRKNIAHNKYH